MLPAHTSILLFAVALTCSSMASVSGQVVRRPPAGEWVVDQTDTFTSVEKQSLNQLCEEIHVKSDAELVIVMIDSTRGQDYVKFANTLRDDWQIGNADRDDGIMVFIAKQDRKFRIVLGDGIDSPGQVQMSQEIYEREIKPNFRAGKFADGIYAAAFQCGEQILGLQTLTSANSLTGATHAIQLKTATRTENIASATPPKEPAEDKRQPTEMTSRDIDQATETMKRELESHSNQSTRSAPAIDWEKNQDEQSNQGVAIMLLITGGTIGLGGITLVSGRWLLKNRIRVCPKCQSELAKLDERQDDEYLEPPEQLEERLGSVRYDVWACMTCEDVVKLRYGVFFTRYSSCPRCQRKTRNKIKRTVVRATEHRGGVIEVTENCANCDYHHQWTYKTPRLSSSNSSNGGRRTGGGFRIGLGGGSSRSGGSSSSGRSSSSGGRRFGGGSSSGRGGGGGW